MSYRFVDSFWAVPGWNIVPSWYCSKTVYKPVWHIPLLGVQWINSWWWIDELSETRRVSWQNKFVKLVHLVGFIIKKLCHSFRLLQQCQTAVINHEWAITLSQEQHGIITRWLRRWWILTSGFTNGLQISLEIIIYSRKVIQLSIIHTSFNMYIDALKLKANFMNN